MPACFLPSGNFATGVSACGRPGETGALSLVIFGAGDAGRCFIIRTAAPNKTPRIANATSDQRMALPMIRSSACTDSSSGSGAGAGLSLIDYFLAVIGVATVAGNSGAPGRCNG